MVAWAAFAEMANEQNTAESTPGAVPYLMMGERVPENPKDSS